MTYNVFSGTLNPIQSINLYVLFCTLSLQQFFMSVTITCAFIIIITSGQSNLTWGCFATTDERFSRICQVAPVCRPMRAHWRHLTNTIEHVSYGSLQSITQTASQLVQPIFHSSWQSVLIFYNGLPFPLKLPNTIGRSASHPLHDSLGPSKPTTQMASRLVQSFLQSVTILYNGLPLLPSKLPLPMGHLDIIHGSLGPPESSTQTASRSVQPFLQGSLVWQTGHATQSVTIGRIYVRSSAMQPNNKVLYCIAHRLPASSLLWFVWTQRIH